MTHTHLCTLVANAKHTPGNPKPFQLDPSGQRCPAHQLLTYLRTQAEGIPETWSCLPALPSFILIVIETSEVNLWRI